AETARPQDVVVELRHRAGDHAERVADTRRQSPTVLSGRQPWDSSSHGHHAISLGRARLIECRHIVIHAATSDTRIPLALADVLVDGRDDDECEPGTRSGRNDPSDRAELR